MTGNNFLPQNYGRELRRHKILKLLAAFGLLLLAILIAGLIFLLPSYFNLILSKNDVLRRLETQEELLARRDLAGLEKEINAVNLLAATYEKNKHRRFAWAGILKDAAEAAPSGIVVSQFNFEPAGNGFAVRLTGKAAARGNLLDYLANLRSKERFSSVDSPISNLLREEEVPFSITVNIKPEFYSYAK